MFSLEEKLRKIDKHFNCEQFQILTKVLGENRFEIFSEISSRREKVPKNQYYNFKSPALKKNLIHPLASHRA